MKKKKVGIITFHNSYNCGSMLQAFALQNVLNKYKVDNEIIDFSNEGQHEVYSVYSKNNNLKNIIKNILMLFYGKKVAKNFESYEEFKKRNFKLSQNKYNKSDELSDKEYSMVVSGSDQVWNITIEDGDDAYFLPWVKNAYKVAYAPSFGAKNILEYADKPDKYRKLISDFDSISIREENGKKWIKELCNKDVPVLLDPTLLLEKSDYEKIATKMDKLPKEYIFYYSPGYKKNINNLVKKISKKYNLPVIAFNAKNFYIKGMNLSSNFKVPEIEDPSVYLSLIKNAKIVVTTSFHGAIFSTIFKKNFWVIKNGGMFGSDDRVLTLVKALDLEDRLIPIEYDETFNYLKEKDYSTYDEKLPKLQKKSQEYIEKNIVERVRNNEIGK